MRIATDKPHIKGPMRSAIFLPGIRYFMYSVPGDARTYNIECVGYKALKWAIENKATGITWP